MRSNHLIVASLVLLLAGCGSLGRLETKSGAMPKQIRDYDRVVVADFAANDLRPAKDEAHGLERSEEMDAGRKAFAASLVEEISKTGAFREVSPTELPAPALQISGTIDRWEPGNVAARALTGFAGKSEFSATVVVSDLETGQELARQVIDRNSWPLPIGASTTIVQTVNYFMRQAARRVADQLAKAKQAPPPGE